MEQPIYLFVALAVGLFVGAGVIWLAQRAFTTRLTERLFSSEKDLQELLVEHDSLRNKKDELSTEITKLTTTLELERTQTKDRLEFREDTQKQLSNQFKILASEILEEKSKKFTDQNINTLDQIIGPLKTKISEFDRNLQEVYFQGGKERSALSEQVKQLLVLNNQLSGDAHNLTQALTGQSKVQGDFGEFILERALEEAGLRKGHEFNVQVSHIREDGTKAQPDVVINLPENRHIVIDAKMSLTAYTKHTKSDNEIDSSTALKKHLQSVHSHIKELSEKNYQQLYGVQSLDFVLMFIPIESAFTLANSNDDDLWIRSFKKNILLASPSTLLYVLRIVDNLWRLEKQSQNAEEISKRGNQILDKLSGFVNDLTALGNRLQQAQSSYDAAYNKLKTGQGNLIHQAEKLIDLGVKPTKPLILNSSNNPILDDPSNADQKISPAKKE
jgi:DNA recombination protein RmuC